jgi:hypothetical protein
VPARVRACGHEQRHCPRRERPGDQRHNPAGTPLDRYTAREEFTLTTLNVRLLPDGRLAVKAYGRPAGGGRGTYVSFPVPDRPELATLIVRAASCAGALWAAHRGIS